MYNIFTNHYSNHTIINYLSSNIISSDRATKEERSQYSKFKVGFLPVKIFTDGQLIAGVTTTKLLHRILDHDSNNKSSNPNSSRIFELNHMV